VVALRYEGPFWFVLVIRVLKGRTLLKTRGGCLHFCCLRTLSTLNPCELSSIHSLVDTFCLQSVRTVFYPPSCGHFHPSVRANCLLSTLLWTLSTFNPCELSSILKNLVNFLPLLLHHKISLIQPPKSPALLQIPNQLKQRPILLLCFNHTMNLRYAPLHFI